MEESRRMRRISLIYVLPAVLLMLFLIGYPLIYNIVISFQDLTLMNLQNAKFVGFDNYTEIFNDDDFWVSLWNTLEFTFWSILLQFTIGFALALFFKENFRLAGFLRG